MSQSRGSILVIRGGAIGDFVLTLPVLAALRQTFPETHLALLGYPHIASLARAGGLVDEVRPIEAQGLASFFCERGTLAEDFADFFADFDVIVSYLFDPDAIFQANVARCSQAQFIQGPHRPVETEGVHATEVLLRPLQRLAIFDADPTPRLRLAADVELARSIAPAARTRRLAVHPGSGSEQKNWPEAHWRQLLARTAPASDCRLLLVGGEAESDRVQHLAALWPGDRLTVAHSLALPDLAARLAQCDGFVGHDSGITHLAAALGLGGLVLWGESNASVWRPRSDRMRLLRAAGGLAALHPDEVHHALLDLLAGEVNP